MLTYQQPHVSLDLLEETAADSIHCLVVQDIRLIVSDLCSQNIVEPTFFDSGDPWQDASSQTKLPSRDFVDSMLLRPGLLHVFVVHIDFIRFVTSFPKTVGVEEWD